VVSYLLLATNSNIPAIYPAPTFLIFEQRNGEGMVVLTRQTKILWYWTFTDSLSYDILLPKFTNQVVRSGRRCLPVCPFFSNYQNLISMACEIHYNRLKPPPPIVFACSPQYLQLSMVTRAKRPASMRYVTLGILYRFEFPAYRNWTFLVNRLSRNLVRPRRSSRLQDFFLGCVVIPN